MTGCVFCARIEAGECEQTEVNSVVMFEPLHPVTPGHMLFVPRAHAESAAASPWQAGNACLAAANYVAREGIEANIITSIGGAATQTVMHLHVHVVPRQAGDGLVLPWTGQQTVNTPDDLWELFDARNTAGNGESLPVVAANGVFWMAYPHEDGGDLGVGMESGDPRESFEYPSGEAHYPRTRPDDPIIVYPLRILLT